MNDYAYTRPALRAASRVIDAIGGVFFRPSERKPGPASVHRAVVFRMDQIGDAFYCTPLLDALKERFPDIVVDVVTTRRCAPVFAGHPVVGDVLLYDYPRFARGTRKDGLARLVSLVRKLRAARYDLAIDPRGEPLAALLGWLSGAPVRAGLAREEVLSFLYTHRVRFDPRSPAWHRFRGILRAIGGDAASWIPRMELGAGERAAAVERAALLGKFLGLHLGAGVPFKRWPVTRFAELARRAKARGLEVAVFGAADERPLAEELAREASGIMDFSGTLSLRETYALLAHAEAFVGNDSAVVHLAGPLGIPSVHLMGASSPGSAAALGPRVFRLVGTDPEHACRTDACPYPCPHMEAVSAGEVIAALGW